MTRPIPFATSHSVSRPLLHSTPSAQGHGKRRCLPNPHPSLAPSPRLSPANPLGAIHPRPPLAPSLASFLGLCSTPFSCQPSPYPFHLCSNTLPTPPYSQIPPTPTPATKKPAMSSIPVPQTAKRPRTATTSSTTATAGPSRIRDPATRSVSASRVAALGSSTRSTAAPATAAVRARRSATAASSLTVPRAPMGNATNRTVTSARTVTTVKPSLAGLGKATSSVRRTVSSASSTSSSQEAEASRMDAMESRLSTMQELFELERQKTEEKWNRERTERLVQEEKVRQLEEDLLEQRKLANSRKEEMKRRRTLADDEMLQLNAKHAREKRQLEEELERERATVSALKTSLAQQSTAHLTMESTHTALRNQVAALQDEAERLRSRIAAMEAEVIGTREANRQLEAELREAETLRRKLHNEVQELRGNIRVFARVRPSTNNDANNGTEALATIRFPNEREANQIEVLAAGESATGTVTMKNHVFTFDRVFQPTATQADVFEEIAHLTQSVLDGYNTSIFAYGQTGSGKTHTLEGAASLLTSSDDPSDDAGAGLIPRAVQMLWKTAESLRDKGWRYDFEGQMLEIYLDNINDLLGKGEVDKAKHEIKHDKSGRTTVSDTVVVPLESPKEVFRLLEKAKKRRQVAATLMNERSSRSHSVFMLRVRGRNETTMEACDAVLSLVDLAGSERLANSGSGADPLRLKEAQSINKSLSSLADVISALGQNKSAGGGGQHVPYRNSTLTWLLKNSLGGNSKTLMLLALSPMAAHLNESLCSLRFATKVNSTTIGTAKAVKTITA
ncbi:kinesin-like nuclear fusion protein [Thecaphora frezii]